MFHEVRLHGEVAYVRGQHGAHAIVAHGVDGVSNAEAVAQRFRYLREGLPLAQQIGTPNVGGQVQVAQIEPGVGAILPQPFQRPKALSDLPE